MLNETLLGEKFWRTGFKFKEAKGDWGKVFIVTEAVLLMMWEKMLREWETRYPKKMSGKFPFPNCNTIGQAS